MATPVAAGFAALVLSHLSRRDFKMKGRGHEVKDRLRYLATISRYILNFAHPTYATAMIQAVYLRRCNSNLAL